MRQYQRVLLFLVAALVMVMGSGPGRAWAKTPKNGKLLYMTLTKGYHHASTELSKQIVKEIGEKSGAFQVTVTEDVGAFTRENLKNYDAVMFNTTGELPMTDEEKSALVDFLKSGHGFVGVHSATDTFYEWGAYNEIIGGYFNNHPWHQLVTIDVVDPNSKLVSLLGKSFQINDEIYQIGDFQADDFACPPGARSRVGGPDARRVCAALLRMADRLDADVRQRSRLLQQSGARRGGLERSPLPGHAPEGHQMGHAGRGLSCA